MLTPITSLIKRPSIQILLLIVSGCLAYSNTFHVPFVLDDYVVIGYNRSLDSVTDLFKSISWLDFSYKSRWFALATFAFNKSIGGVSVVGFHALNLLIHLATGLAVYYLTKSTIATFGEKQLQRYAFAPLLASLGFLLHPVQTEAVTYIVQRMTSLATLLYLVTLLLYADTFRIESSPEPRLNFRNYLFYLFAIIFCLLAMSTKEICFTLPVAMVLFDSCFLTGSGRQRVVRLLPFILCALIMPLYLVGIDTGVAAISRGGGDVDATSMPRLSYFYTECRVLITYMRLLILPVGQSLDYDYPVYNSLFEVQVAASIAFLALFSGMGIFCLRSSFKNGCKFPALLRISGFAIIWFFIGHAIESGVIPLLDTIFEHRLYLPSVWFFIASAVIVCELYHRAARAKPYIVATALILLVLLGCLTYRRNNVWKDRRSLWTDVVQKAPNNVRGLTNLGRLLRSTDLAAAISLLERAIANNPEYYPAHSELALALTLQGDSRRALYHHLTTTRLAPNYAKGWENTGLYFLGQGNYPEALFFLRRAYELDPAGFTSQESLQKVLQMK